MMIDLQKKMHFRFIKKDKGYGEYYMESSRKRKEDDPIALLRRKKRKRRMIRELTGRIIFLVNVILFIVLLVMVVKNSSNSRKMKEQNSLPDSWSNEKSSKENSEDDEEESLISDSKIDKFAQMYSGKKDSFLNYTVCIDAGHGGSDCGAKTNTGIEEKEQTLILAKKVRQYLESLGINVVMTRTKDVELSLEERRDIANNANADVLVSIHRNMYNGLEKIGGIEAWINNSEPYEARKIAEDILDNITGCADDINNRGVKSGSMDDPYENFGMNKVEMTSMIIEVGFMSSSYDNHWFRRHNDDIAEAIAKGIADNVMLFYYN